MNYSLIQLRDKIQEFANAHLQVNSFYAKDPLEVLNDKEGVFPCIVMNVVPSQFKKNEISLNVQMFFMDLVSKDLSNEYDVLSDQLRIARDFYIWMDQPEFADLFIFDPNSSITPFFERGDNEVTGWSVNFVARLRDSNDMCELPIE